MSDSAVQAETEKQRALALDVWTRKQDRLAAVSYRLTRSSSELCKDGRPAYGFIAHDITSYSKDYRYTAAHHLGLGDWAVVRYVQPDFPAAVGGMLVGDSLTSINGRSIEGMPMKEVMSQVSRDASTRDSLRIGVRRMGQPVVLSMLGVRVCDYSASVTGDDLVNAYADGENIYIASGMMRFAETDDELALVVGHELSHNSLGHMGKKKGNALLGALLDATVTATTGIRTGGVFSDAGAKAFSKQFESEADYQGLYMVVRAGFDITNAPQFWRRMAAEHPGSIKKTFMATHPSTPERFLALEGAVAEIGEKQLRAEALFPYKKSDRRHDPMAVKTASRSVESDRAISTAPYTIMMEDGSSVPALSLQPWGMGQVRVVRLDNKIMFLNPSKVRTILDLDGRDWSREVLDAGTSLPR